MSSAELCAKLSSLVDESFLGRPVDHVDELNQDEAAGVVGCQIGSASEVISEDASSGGSISGASGVTVIVGQLGSSVPKSLSEAMGYITGDGDTVTDSREDEIAGLPAFGVLAPGGIGTPQADVYASDGESTVRVSVSRPESIALSLDDAWNLVSSLLEP